MPWRPSTQSAAVNDARAAADAQSLEILRPSPRPLPPLSLQPDGELLAMAIAAIAPDDDATLARYLGCTTSMARAYRADPASLPAYGRMRVYGTLECGRFLLFELGRVDPQLELLYEALSGRLRAQILEHRRRHKDPYAGA